MAASSDPTVLVGPLAGTTHSEVGGLLIDESPAGAARVKRVIYPAGWRWREQMQPVTGTEWCQHAHVGFLAQGSMTVRYADGCEIELVAPTTVVISPGHEGWVTSDDACVLVQVDCGTETVQRFSLAEAHTH